jgi:2-isopropylmalate synthase
MSVRTEQIRIFDTTLRDGEQCPGGSMNLREKLEVARQLARLNVDVIEGGFPVISDGDFEAVSKIAREVKGPIICGLARCVSKDIDAAGAAVKPAGAKGRIHVFLATSKIHRDHKLQKAKEEILRLAVDGVRRARNLVDDVEFSPEDASRTEPEFLADVTRAVIEAGATTVNIPDTTGYAVPKEFGALIKYLFDNVSNIHDAVISVHCHNDLGLAVANSLAAVENGARQVECTVNGIGERAGNASLEEIAMALRARKDYFGSYTTGIHTEEILRSSRLVSRMSGLMVQRNKAIVGENAFAHSAGIHQDGVLKKSETYEIMDPREVGWGKSELPLTKHSGRHAVNVRLKHLGFTLSEAELVEVFTRFKEIGDKKKFVYDEDLVALVDDRFAEVPEVFSLESFSIAAETGSAPRAGVRIRKGKQTHEGTGTGDGPVDALLKAIDQATGIRGRLRDYQVRSATQGKDALGEVTVAVDFGSSEPVVGKGASTDVIDASARAYVNAINRSFVIGKQHARKVETP